MEFVLVFPLLLAILAAIVDLGRLIHVHLKLSEVVQDAARYATALQPRTGTVPTSAQVLDRIESAIPMDLGLSSHTVESDFTAVVDGLPALHIKVTGRVAPFNPLVTFLVSAQVPVAVEIWYPRRST